MLRKILHMVFLVSVISVLGFLLFMFFSKKLDLNGEESFNEVSFGRPNVEINDYLVSDSVGFKMDVDKYLSEVNYQNPLLIEEHLNHLNSVFGNSTSHEKFLSEVLIDSVIYKYGFPDNLDTSRFLIDWASAFSNHKKYSNYPVFFDVVSDHWFLFCIDSILVKKVSLDNSLKYDFRIKYLQEVLYAYNYNFSIKETKFEKIIKYIHLGEWKYLFIQRFWKSTSFYFKLLVLIPILFLILGLCKYIFK
jgi:hypothetical protein